jgi:hypothetical protein
MLLCALGLSRTNTKNGEALLSTLKKQTNREKTTGWNIFAGIPFLVQTLYAKISYAPCQRLRPSVFWGFCRSLSADGKGKNYFYSQLKISHRLNDSFLY